MPACMGKSYLLGESSESHTAPMNLQLVMALTVIKTQLTTLPQTVKAFGQEQKRRAPFMTYTARKIEESDNTIPLEITHVIK